MASSVFDPPERFVAGTVGPPGGRTFFLQASGAGRLVSVSLEKVQVSVLADRVNEFIDSEKPWDLAKRPDDAPRLHRVCSDALRAFRDLILMLSPVLPATAAKAGEFLNLGEADWAQLREPLPAGGLGDLGMMSWIVH